MTIDEIVQYYKDLIILQYRNKPKALATIDAMVRPVIMDQLPLTLQDAFNLDTATGVQLDILGKYIGIARRVQTFTEWVTLSDADYRMLLKIKIALNNLGSSLYDIQNFIITNLNGILLAFDSQNMQMSFYLNSTFVSLTLAQAIVRQGLLPKPMGVSTSSIVFVPDLSNLFGFRYYAFQPENIVGFNSYVGFDSNTRFLSYTNVLIF